MQRGEFNSRTNAVIGSASFGAPVNPICTSGNFSNNRFANSRYRCLGHCRSGNRSLAFGFNKITGCSLVSCGIKAFTFATSSGRVVNGGKQFSADGGLNPSVGNCDGSIRSDSTNTWNIDVVCRCGL